MTELKKTLGGVQFFSLGFGTVVGVGWIVYMGLWFSQAGPVGTMIAFLLGGLFVSLIGLCYAELGSMYPVAGAEAAYGYRAFGQAASFAAGWAMVLMMTAVVPYVSISLAWILDALVPGIGGPVLYTWRGQSIQALGLAITLGWTLWLGFLNYRGIQGAAKFQDWLTYGKIAISVLFFGLAFFGGSAANVSPGIPAAPTGGLAWGGLLAVLATTPWFFGGFNGIPQAFEERAEGTSARTLGLIVVASVLAASVYYGVSALATGFAAPWQDVVKADLPVAAAYRIGFGEWAARLVLLAGIFGVVTVGNGAMIAATRLLFALGRARMITPGFTKLHPGSGAPVAAINFVLVFGVAGAFLGKGGIAPIVNVGSAAACLAYLVSSLAVWRLRTLEPDRPRPYRIPMGVGVSLLAAGGSLFLLWSALRQHWIDAAGSFPLEWVVILVWTALGYGLWLRAAPSRAALAPGEQRKIVVGDT